MFPVSHKTIFVLDQTPNLVETSCQQPVEFDVLTKSRQPTGIIPLAPIAKSLWTCALEAVSEYCRLIWDIFPEGDRLIRFVSCGTTRAQSLISWHEEAQNLSTLMNTFAKISILGASLDHQPPANASENWALTSGLEAAAEALGEPSLLQKQVKEEKGYSDLVNRGRVICISFFRNDAQIMKLQETFLSFLENHNSLFTDPSSEVKLTANKLPINQCELIFINTYPVNDQSQSSKIMDMPLNPTSPLLSCQVFSVKSGTFFAQKMSTLVLRHYDLASTTVTGIPMKEEQNASSSANYDVEIFHSAGAHLDLYKSGNVDGVRVPKEGLEYDTITLKWCTPRTNAVELHYSTASNRITPVDVNSRPSSCLTNFLLSGRTVMLEMPRMKGNKFMSHMLSSHNNELYIHTLGSGRSILEDPPSISEGSGGRVTDYRINDFGELMKKNKMVRCKSLLVPGKEVVAPIEKAKQSLVRQTLYWPIVIGHTIMFNIQPQIQALLTLIPKESLTIEDVNECKNALYQVVNMESKGTPLPVPSISSRGKGPKREELYKLLWKELLHFIKLYAASPEHEAVLSCYNELHAKTDIPETITTTTGDGAIAGSPAKKALPSNGSKVKEVELAWKELDRFNQLTEKEKHDADDEPSKKKPRPSTSAATPESCFATSCGQQSLLTIWTKKLDDEQSKKHIEFAGRVASNGNIAPLYTQLNEKPGD